MEAIKLTLQKLRPVKERKKTNLETLDKVNLINKKPRFNLKNSVVFEEVEQNETKINEIKFKKCNNENSLSENIFLRKSWVCNLERRGGGRGWGEGGGGIRGEGEKQWKNEQKKCS